MYIEYKCKVYNKMCLWNTYAPRETKSKKTIFKIEVKAVRSMILVSSEKDFIGSVHAKYDASLFKSNGHCYVKVLPKTLWMNRQAKHKMPQKFYSGSLKLHYCVNNLVLNYINVWKI